MYRDPKTLLWDMAQAANTIARTIDGVTFDEYTKTETIHSTVERKFEIIGEALNQLRKIAPELASKIPEAGKIIGFRNLLIHGYAFVEHSRVWAYVKNELPSLHAAIQAALAE